MFISKNFTLGQMNALVKKLGGEDVVTGILNGTVKFTVQAAEAVSSLIDPDSFFRNRRGLYVWDHFRSRVVAKAAPSAVIPAFKHVELTQAMNDAEIEKMLGDGHLFTETEVAALIADLIAKQEGGKKGELLNNDYANLFYLGSCVVFLRWYPELSGWNVAVHDRRGLKWHAGDRVFSPAN